jgi:hypothetical protein
MSELEYVSRAGPNIYNMFSPGVGTPNQLIASGNDDVIQFQAIGTVNAPGELADSESVFTSAINSGVFVCTQSGLYAISGYVGILADAGAVLSNTYVSVRRYGILGDVFVDIIHGERTLVTDAAILATTLYSPIAATLYLQSGDQFEVHASASDEAGHANALLVQSGTANSLLMIAKIG